MGDWFDRLLAIPITIMASAAIFGFVLVGYTLAVKMFLSPASIVDRVFEVGFFTGFMLLFGIGIALCIIFVKDTWEGKDSGGVGLM